MTVKKDDGDDRRRKMIAAATAAVRKTFKGSISDVASVALEFPSVWASTGSLSFDRLFTGFNPGGLPIGPRFGRIIHMPGEWSTGKSVVLDHMLRSVIVDLRGLGKRSETEGSADPHFANAIGLPLDLLSVDRPDTIETMFDMFIEWHESVRKQDAEIPVLWGVDSLDSTESERAADHGLSESGGWRMGGGASEALGAGLRKVTKCVSRYPTTIVLINQTRDNVGVMFGPKKRTSKGNAPHFYASLEVWLSGSPRPGHGYVRADVDQPKLTKETVRRLGLYNLEDTAVVGRYIRAKVTKTKMSTTLDTTADFYIDFRKGIHLWEGLLERLVAEGRVRPNGDMTEFEMVDRATGEMVKYGSKKEWLNFVAQHLEVLGPRPDEER